VADVMQESHNRIEKAIYGRKTYLKLSFLSEVVSANIPMLREHANQIERFYSTWTSVSHTEKDQFVDIQTLLQHFLHERVYILTNGRESDFEPLHTWVAGMGRLPAELSKWRNKLNYELANIETYNEEKLPGENTQMEGDPEQIDNEMFDEMNEI
jgi:recombinational DNA repair ATPase RecF